MKQLTKLAICLASVLMLNSACAENKTQWRTPNLENLAVMTLPQGKVVIELAPEFAPNHIEHFKSLIKSGHYQGNKFYRVIDGFVAQAGPAAYVGQEKEKTLKIEPEVSIFPNWEYTQVQAPDMFAEHTGFKQGFAVGVSASEKKAWLTHCPGVLAMARGNKPDTATSHFYITNGQAPRYLDRIMTVLGRVIYGMEHVQSIVRTSVIEGQEPVDSASFTQIASFTLMSELPKSEQINLQVEDTESPAFEEKLAKRRSRPSEFFYKKPPPVLDVCQVPVKTRIKS
ncbi:peptidylprolyl isomerase [Thalassotalea sp. M1531]|uniref:peptidylprolyl isomerase n=1 Tax=Thalassotalea algicola TaxID=2716224 RepID=A0A7Y0Q868_9GAMM|nr:peptidylprolyl isomerase [Thalassotalea algicola]NMP33153.1 peptidylprolyl isomerase [Thalassotalea algicola]